MVYQTRKRTQNVTSCQARVLSSTFSLPPSTLSGPLPSLSSHQAHAPPPYLSQKIHSRFENGLVTHIIIPMQNMNEVLSLYNETGVEYRVGNNQHDCWYHNDVE